MVSRPTFIALIALLLCAGAAFFAWSSGVVVSPFAALTGSGDTPYGCTKEARVCSDGTIVTRSGSACTFAECPNDRITDLTPSSTPAELPVSTTPPTLPPSGDTSTMCAMDAKQCPDGSYVGRSGPNCEFVCPAEPLGGTITVHGVVMVGPTCPVTRTPSDTSCAERPYQGVIMLTNTSNGQSYTAQTDEKGTFTLTLKRGVYDVSRPAGMSPFPSCSGKIEITAPGGPIPIYCDSGIR